MRITTRVPVSVSLSSMTLLILRHCICGVKCPVDTTKTKTLDLGTAFHCRVLEPEEFSNRFIVAPEFNRRTNAGKEEEKAFLMECASTGKRLSLRKKAGKLNSCIKALWLCRWGNGLLKAPDTLNHQFTGKILKQEFCVGAVRTKLSLNFTGSWT